MIDGSKRVEFSDVQVIRARGGVVICRIGNRTVAVPRARMLGAAISHAGDRGRLALPHDVAVNLGLA
jgi:hypothetical protein